MIWSTQAFFCAVGRWALGAVILASPVSTASGLMITTSGTSGGNPGGQPLYVVSDLVEGDAFNLEWGGVSGLSVSGMVFIDSLTDTDADIRVMLDNQSTPISGIDPRVSSFGFAADDFSSLDTATTGGTYLDNGDTPNPSIPGFIIDVCAAAGTNCAGGGNAGIPAGDQDEFTLQISGNFLSSLTLRDFGLKVQGGPSGNSFELSGVASEKVPEPASLVLVLLGAGLVGFLRGQRA